MKALLPFNNSAPLQFGRLSERLETARRVLKSGEASLYRNIYMGLNNDDRMDLLYLGDTLLSGAATLTHETLNLPEPVIDRFLSAVHEDIDRYFTVKTGKPLQEWLIALQSISKDRKPFEAFVRQLQLAQPPTSGAHHYTVLPDPDIYDPLDLIDASMAKDQLAEYEQSPDEVPDALVLDTLNRMYHPQLVEKALNAVSVKLSY